jgi:hypothetical protein
MMFGRNERDKDKKSWELARTRTSPALLNRFTNYLRNDRLIVKFATQK